MITVVVGKEIEKVKGDYESYLNGLNMVGEITYSQYSKLYDEGTKQIQKAYELGKSELEKENAELKEKNRVLDCMLTGESLVSNERKHQLDKARELILKLYNAGRDVLMCRADEKAYDNLSEAIDDKGIEQFLSEVENDKV